jgi:ABC-type uncharacterized transport system involved in gliding motility auxiliary subunit/ABC-type transport system involved in cytochrome c biogenesis permease component
MSALTAVFRRDIRAAFASPIVGLYMAAFGTLATVATFEWGDFYARGQADLSAAFALLPWLLVWLTPALSMRFWSEERRQGTVEPLLALPIPLHTLVTAKWLAGVGALMLGLLTTLPLWATVTYLGHPDHGAVIAGYAGTLLLGATLLAVGSACSAATRHPIVAYITASVTGTLLLVAGHPLVSSELRLRLPASLWVSLTDLGALPHHQALVRGVLGADDLAYFAGLTAIGLVISSLLLRASRGFRVHLAGRSVPTTAAITAILAVFMLASPWVSRLCGHWRLDLTEERLYTLSPATQALLSSLDKPVTLTLYASDRTLASAPAYAAEARRLRELLTDMSARAREHLHFVTVDPAPFSDDEDRAAEAGLRSLSLGEAGDNLWLGLVADAGQSHAAIDLFEPNQAPFLEYRIARLIREVARPVRPVIGLLSTLPMGPIEADGSAMPHPAWTVDDELRDHYDVRDILPDASALPAHLDALVILHPRGLSADLVQSIGRYVSHGGRALIAVDPDAQFDGQVDNTDVGVDHASTLEPLLRRWGVHFDPTLAIGDLDNALLVGSGRSDRPVRHLGFLGFGRDSLDERDPLTRGLHRLDFATPGYLDVDAVPGVTITALVQTSTHSAPLRVADLVFGATPETLRHGFHPTGRRYTLAARLQGRLADGNGSAATAPADVVIVADTDWLADMMWIRDDAVGDHRYREPWANNGDFLLNAVDELSGGNALIGLRGREPRARPFTRLEAIRTEADRRLAGQLEALERSLAEVNQRLADLTAGSTGNAEAANPQQRAALADAERERRRLSRALRGVRHDLDREAAKLGRSLYAIDVLIPLCCGIAVVLWSRRRRRSDVHPT